MNVVHSDAEEDVEDFSVEVVREQEAIFETLNSQRVVEGAQSTTSAVCTPAFAKYLEESQASGDSADQLLVIPPCCDQECLRKSPDEVRQAKLDAMGLRESEKDFAIMGVYQACMVTTEKTV